MLVGFFQRRNIYYGWVVLAVAFLTMFLVMGFRFAFGVYYVAILEDTGWTRAETAGIFSTAMIVYAMFSMMAGALFDWLGPRVLFPAGCVVMGLGLMLCSTIETVWQFYLYYGGLVGLAYSLVGFITHMAYVPRWFVRKRGLAASLALSGIGAGALAISILSEKLLLLMGWRDSFWLFGLLILCILTPLTLLFHRDSPESIGLRPDGDDGPITQATADAGGGPGLLLAVRMPAFWMLFVAVLTIGMGNMTLVVHQTRLLVDAGYAFSLAAVVLGITGFLRSFGGLIWGGLSDRVGRQACVGAASLLGVLSLAMLLGMGKSENYFLLGGFVVLWGMGYTGISPLYASTAADLFQGRHLGKILGMLDQGFGIGAATGPFLAGWIFDRFGSYDLMLWGLTGTVTLTGLALWGTAATLPARR